jgi:acetate---CoA ligase (ADP-forming)
VTVANPLDYHTFIWGDGPRTTDVFTTMLQAYDAGIYIIDPPRTDRCDPAWYEPAIGAIVAAQEAAGKPAFPVASMPENFDEGRAAALMDQGICTLMGLETALVALRAAQTGAGVKGWRPLAVVPDADAVMLDEAASKAMLAAVGVAVPRRVTAAKLADLDVAGLAGPFALKGLGFAHKTEAGAVRLGLTTLAGQAEMAGATGYLAEEMVQGVVAELLVGLRRDAVYGATLTLGFGGITTELLADTVTLVCPVTGDEVAAGLRRLRLWPLLDGYRGKPAADVAAVVDAVLAVQGMLADATLQEVEINPLMACQKGAVAVDAVIWRNA